MKHLKLALCLSAAAFFACDRAADTRPAASTDATTTPSPVVGPTATLDELAAARTTYNAACVRCHQPNGEGGLVELDEQTKLKVPSFKQPRVVAQADQRYTSQITNGGDGMPAFKKRLTPEQINDLVRLVRRDFQAELTPNAPPLAGEHK